MISLVFCGNRLTELSRLFYLLPKRLQVKVERNLNFPGVIQFLHF